MIYINIIMVIQPYRIFLKYMSQWMIVVIFYSHKSDIEILIENITKILWKGPVLLTMLVILATRVRNGTIIICGCKYINFSCLPPEWHVLIRRMPIELSPVERERL